MPATRITVRAVITLIPNLLLRVIMNSMYVFLNSPACIALAALFIGMLANALAYWKAKQDDRIHREQLLLSLCVLDDIQHKKLKKLVKKAH